MGVIEYNQEPDADSIEFTENEIINKINSMQNQLNEFGQILKEIKKDLDQLKSK